MFRKLSGKKIERCGECVLFDGCEARKKARKVPVYLGCPLPEWTEADTTVGEQAERIRELEAENAKLRAEAERMKDQARENNGRIRNPDLPNCLMCKNSVDGCGNCGWTEPPESVITRLKESNGSMEKAHQSISDLSGFNGKPGDIGGLMEHVRKLRAGFDRATTLAANALNHSRELEAATKPSANDPTPVGPDCAGCTDEEICWGPCLHARDQILSNLAVVVRRLSVLEAALADKLAKPEPAPAAELPKVCIVRVTYSRDDYFRLEAVKGHLTQAQAEAMRDMLNNRAKWEALREAAWKLIGTSQDLRVFGGKISGSNAYRQEEKVRAALAALEVKS